MTKLSAAITGGSSNTDAGINASTSRTSWMANNAIPDSIIMNMIFRNLLTPAEPRVRSTEVLGIAPMTLKILNAIMPVIKVFTAMDAAKPVIYNVFGQSLSALSLL